MSMMRPAADQYIHAFFETARFSLIHAAEHDRELGPVYCDASHRSEFCTASPSRRRDDDGTGALALADIGRAVLGGIVQTNRLTEAMR